MGAHPYWYTAPYDPDVGSVLGRLRLREFQARRYNPVMPFIKFPITPQSPAPGPQHARIEDVFADADASGTRSILDISSLSAAPDYCAASPLPDAVLERLYGTTRPTRTAVEANLPFSDDMERGQAVYVVLFDSGQPAEVMFAGLSFD